MRRFLLPRLQEVIFIVVLLSGLLLGSRMLNTDSDLGRHITLGRYMLTTAQIPTQDVLSFTRAGLSRPPYEWLAQVLLALAHELLNLDGVVLLASVIIAAAFLVVYLDCARRSDAPILSMLLAFWAAAASSLHWLPRPHIFSFIFFAVWLSSLDRIRRNEGMPWWQFPALMLLWANTHGGFVFGFLAGGAYLAGWLVDFLRSASSREVGMKLGLAVGSSAVTSILTPDLWNNWGAVLGNRSSYILSQTVETMPPRLSAPGVWPFLGLLALMIFLLFLRRKTVSPAHVILLATLAASSLAMARNIPLFAIAAAPICAQWLAESPGIAEYWLKVEEGFARIDRMLAGSAWAATAVLAVALALVYRQHRTQSTLYQFSPRALPVAAVDWFVSHPKSGNVFNDFNWGGYLLLRTWPTERVFVDSQSDFYGETFIRQYAGILGGSTSWDEQLAQYGVTWILIPPSAPLAERVRHDERWQLAYEDSTAVIFERK